MPLIAFDLDGTLVDSQRDLADSANELLASCGAAPLEPTAVTAMVGEGARVLVGRVLAAGGVVPPPPDGLDRFLEIYERRMTNHTMCYPGVYEALEAVSPRAEMALVTNKPEHHTRAILDALGLAHFFRWVVGGDSGFPRKPDPAGLRHVVRQWMAEAPSAAARDSGQALFVGDSMVDAETARQAGVRLCLAGYGFGRVRGDLRLEGDELVAEESTALEAVLTTFLDDVIPT